MQGGMGGGGGYYSHQGFEGQGYPPQGMQPGMPPFYVGYYFPQQGYPQGMGVRRTSKSWSHRYTVPVCWRDAVLVQPGGIGRACGPREAVKSARRACMCVEGVRCGCGCVPSLAWLSIQIRFAGGVHTQASHATPGSHWGSDACFPITPYHMGTSRLMISGPGCSHAYAFS